MPRVKIYDDNVVQLAQTTDARFRAADNNGGIGGAIGAGLQDVGGALADRAKAQEEIDFELDNTMRQRAAVDYQARVRPLITQYQSLEGLNALNARPEIEKQIADIRREIGGTLTTPRMKRMFDDSVDPYDTVFSDNIAGHATEQLKVERSRVNEARLTQATDGALDNYKNPALVDTYMQSGLAAIDDAALDRGWNDQTVTNEKEKYTSGVRRSVVGQLLGSGDVDGAIKYAADHDGDLTGGDRLAISNALRGPLELREASSDYDRAKGSVPPVAATPPEAAPAAANAAPPTNMFGAVVSLESNGNHRNRDGTVKVSPAGAVGIAQVMPATGPEAARLAGVAWDPVKFREDPAYNKRLGEAYFNQQLKTFGDPAKAAAAYNAGPGAVRSAISKAEKAGKPESWLSYLPAETRQYVTGFRAKAGGAGATAEAGPARLDLGSIYANIDTLAAKEGWSVERTERAKDFADREVQRQDRVIAREEGAAADEAADIVAKLGDNFTSMDQIPEDVRGRMSPQLRLSLTGHADNNKARQQAATQDLNNYTNATNTPDFTWNPYDKGHVDAAEAAVKAKGGTAQAALQVFEQTGILAPTGVAAIRGGLASPDPKRFRATVNIAGNMLRRNPNAFAAVPGGEDIAKQAAQFNHYTYDLGVDPDQAAARVLKENSPEARSRTQITDAQVTQIRTDIRKTGAPTPTSIFGSGAVFADDATKVRFGNDYVEIVVDEVRNGRDINTAKAMASQQLQRTWGMTRGGGVVKYPPERGYPAIGGGHDYLYRDAIATVKKETGNAASPATIRLAPVPGVTDEDFRTGKPPRYRIVYSYEHNGQRVYDTVPGLWAADTTVPKAKADAEARAGFGRARAARQQNLDEAARAKADVGGDYLSDPFK